jgi:hypothetical protein
VEVPGPVRARRAGRSFWLLVALAFGIFAWAVNQWMIPRPAPAQLTKDRLAADLHRFSPFWQAINWEQCDKANGHYRLSAYYQTARETYVFSVRRFSEIDMTTVEIDPRPTGYLALADFHWSDLERFDYRGRLDQERRDLETLARQLNDALAAAVP